VKNDSEGNTVGVRGCSVDVALALQYLVEGSRLQLHSARKAGLPGFYDVAPTEDKVSVRAVQIRNNNSHRAPGVVRALPVQGSPARDVRGRRRAAHAAPEVALPARRRAAQCVK
jgi:hypothetical protein